MDVAKTHLKHMLHYEFHKRNALPEATRNIHSLYEGVFVNKRNCKKGYFQSPNRVCFSLRNRPKIVDPTEFDNELILPVFEKNKTL